MYSTNKVTASDALSLGIPERLRLVEAIWDRIAELSEVVPVTAAQRAELDRRLRQYQEESEAACSWGEVRERIVRRL